MYEYRQGVVIHREACAIQNLAVYGLTKVLRGVIILMRLRYENFQAKE